MAWRMPAAALTTRRTISTGSRLGLAVLRGYPAVAAGLVVVRMAQLAIGH